MDYMQREKAIKDVINKKYGFNDSVFIDLLKNHYNKSTKYLKTLMSENMTNKQKLNKINYILKKCNLNLKKVYRYYDKPISDIYNKDIVEYGLNKWQEVCIKKCRTETIRDLSKVKRPARETIYLIDL